MHFLSCDLVPPTVFPRNLAAATFNFVVQFGAATFRGRRLKYSLHYYSIVHVLYSRTLGERARCALFRINVNIYNVRMRGIIMTTLYHMRREFEGGV